MQFWYAVIFIFGLIIGSFLNVVIYRLHTGKSLNDRSHCLSCGHTLSWYELFPLFSYLLLLGRCLHCRSHIPSRYFLVELLTGLSFLMVFSYTQNVVAVVLLLILMATLIVGAVYDLYHMIIPDEIVVVSSVLSLAFVMYTMPRWSPTDLSLSILSGTVAFAVFGALWWYSSGRWIGLGDAKLAFPLGVLIGVSHIFSFVVVSFWIGAVLGVILLGSAALLRRGQKHLRFPSRTLTMKSEIPFAPFMVLSFVVVFFFGVDVLSFTNHAIELLFTSIT